MQSNSIPKQFSAAQDETLNLRAHDWVEVRSREEILATLDARGHLDNLPFMPEMFQFCGQKLRVFKRADKTCQTVTDWTLRRLTNSVVLEGVRCDGSGHDGCEARCLIFWKEAWLKRTEAGLVSSESLARPAAAPPRAPVLCTVESILAATRLKQEGQEALYTCQSTDALEFTTPLRWWDVRHFIRDFKAGNLDTLFPGDSRSERALVWLVKVLKLVQAAVVFMSWQRVGVTYPSFTGKLDKTPLEKLDLQPGELVQVRSKEEIVATLDKQNRNRGLLFDRELLPYCGGIYRVAGRVHKIVDEKTRKMLDMKNPCIILEGVVCRAEFHGLCPKQVYTYWRENWLRRVSPTPSASSPRESQERPFALSTTAAECNLEKCSMV